jgi:hypothetical protein
MQLSQFQVFQFNKITPCTQIWAQTHQHISETIWDKIRTPIWDHCQDLFGDGKNNYGIFNPKNIVAMIKFKNTIKVLSSNPEWDIRNEIERS